MQKEFEIAYGILDSETRSLKYKIKWIRASRHHDFLGVVSNLFLEYSSTFGTKNPTFVLNQTWISISQAYPAHKIHDWKRLGSALEQYWKNVEEQYEAPLPLQF